MNLEMFLEKLKKGIVIKMQGAAEVKINEVIKNNGFCLHGLTITEKDRNISPTIYVDDMYQEYIQGRPISEIVDSIIVLYHKSRLEKNINMEFFLKYENVKERIVYKLIDYNRNQELLERIPHVPYLNLAIVFYYMVNEGPFGNATILIQNNHCRIWDKKTEDIYKDACINTPKILPVQIKGMDEIICEMMEKQVMEEDPGMAEKIMEEVGEIPGERRMYVLSNNMKMQGASALLYPGVLQDFSKALGKGFYILPSSIHEVILVPEVGDEEPKLMEAMVCEINETQLDVEEVLSDKVYYYSREQRTLCLCEG